MNNTLFQGLCEGTPTFIKYLRNWCSKGVLSLGITFLDANPDFQKNAQIE